MWKVAEEIVAIFAENERLRDGWIEKKNDLEKIRVLHCGDEFLGFRSGRDDAGGEGRR